MQLHHDNAIQDRISGWLKHQEYRLCLYLATKRKTHQFEGTISVFISLEKAWSSYYRCRQGHTQTCHEYLKDFQGLILLLEHYGAALGSDRPYQASMTDQVMKDAPAGLTIAERNK